MLTAVNVVVLPYRVASQSGVALAALRFGIPLIVSRVGALPELMEGALDEWIVEPNDPAGLSVKLSQFLTRAGEVTPELAESMRIVASNHSWDAIAEKYVALYHTL